MVEGAGPESIACPCRAPRAKSLSDEEAMRVSRETWIVAALCAADPLIDLFLVRQHGADEGNALMSFYLQHGTGTFIAANVSCSFPALLIAEWYRWRNPRLIRRRFAVSSSCIFGFDAVGRVPGQPAREGARSSSKEYPAPQTAPVFALPLPSGRILGGM